MTDKDITDGIKAASVEFVSLDPTDLCDDIVVPVFDLKGLPLPIVSSGFAFPVRQQRNVTYLGFVYEPTNQKWNLVVTEDVQT